MLRTVIFVVVLTAVATLLGCDKGPSAAVKEPDMAEVIGPVQAAGDKIDVDIYVDATASMAGFVADPRSVYVKFLQALDGAVISGWANATRKFYRFGGTVKPMTQAAFIEAGVRGFYTEVTTNIDVVASQANPAKVSVIITDLFETDANVNAIVDRIKAQCLQRGISVGILGVPSQFDGMVYDAPGGNYKYSSGAATNARRPFYAIMFGAPGNLTHLVDALAGTEGVDKSRFTLITPFIVNSVSASIDKGKDVKSMNVVDPGKRFRLVGDSSNDGKFTVALSITRAPYALQFVPGKLELEAYRSTRAKGQDSIVQGKPTDDFKVTALKATSGGLALDLDYTLHPAGERKGVYDYVLYLRTAQNDGFEPPSWVRGYSSENPTAARDANRTLNLEKFVQLLMTSASAIRRPYVAKFWLTVEAH